MFTRMTIISERKVWFQHVGECNFRTQCDFDTHKCDNNTHTHKSWFLHAECDVDTYEYDYDTHTCQNHTLHVEITLVSDVHTHTVISTRTSVIYIHRVWFLHAGCNFHTQCDVETQKCDYDTHDCDFNNPSRVISTRRVWFWNIWVWLWKIYAAVEGRDLRFCEVRGNV
jgi:hypothetical protein